FGASKPQKPSRVDCESSEQLRGRKDDEVSRWETESARKRSLDEIDAFDGACHNFAEPLDLAFSLKINYDPGVVRAPFFQALDELCAFCLGEHEIAGTKLSNLAICKCAREILDFASDVILSEAKRSRRIPRRCLLVLQRDSSTPLGMTALFDPTLADLDVCMGSFLRLDIDD